MHIYVGKTTTSRYDHRAPIHLAVTSDEDATGPRSICSNKPVSQISTGWPITVTCRACEKAAEDLRNLLSF